MATQTYYPLDAAVAGQAWLDVSTNQPATATGTTAWINGTVVTARFSKMDALVKQVAASFGATALPVSPLDAVNGDAVCIPAQSGTYASANWVCTFGLVGSQTNGSVRLDCRLYRSVNADGSSATQITSTAQTGTTYTVTTTAGTSVVTFNPGAFTLTNEFLFLQVACETVTAGGSTTRFASLRTGTSNIVTSDFTPTPSTIYSRRYTQAVARASYF